MTTYNTGNPIGSTDPRDLYDNAENLDTAMNTPAISWTDRLGNARQSWAGATGYQHLGDYAAGVQVTTYNQVIRASGEYWRAAAGTVLPYTTTGAGMPESGKFVSVGDAILRADLVDGDGSSLVGFQQSGAGSVVRTAQDKMREFVSVKDFGAVGDGVADDTTAIQSALNTGKAVYFPSGTSFYRITSQVSAAEDYQRIFSVEGAEIRQETANANVLAIVSRAGVEVSGLRLRAPGTSTSYSNGNGVYILDSEYCRVEGCTVINHRGAGVNLYSSNYCEVVGNTFLDSPVAHLDQNTQTFADIAVVYSSKGNRVTGNVCRSGQATGIQVQSIAGSGDADRNVVIGNVVEGAKAYGIIAYRQNPDYTQDTVSGTVISGNTIKTVYGTILNVATSSYAYGSGIYVQGADGTVVVGNTVEDAHAGAAIISPSVFVETLSPAGIGCINVTRVVISGNIVNQSGMIGIEVASSGNGDVLGQAVVIGNIVTRARIAGIRVRERGRAIVSNNAVDTVVGVGVRVYGSGTLYENVAVTSNSVANSSSSGIQVEDMDGPVVASNIVESAGIHGISVSACVNPKVNSNTVHDHASRGIEIASSCTGGGGSVIGNTVDGTGSSEVGIVVQAKMNIDRTNSISGCAAPWSGNYAVLRGLNSAEFAATSGSTETNICTFSIPANTLTVNGDSFKFAAFGSTANNANVKTL
ncbi:MAG: right-handed parallel beta-helix repeat-containing protein, partial [Anaerolineae bacterium]|nr:right-handed parallel beta-helix repeat-containing protein [Anaerolineae bacterium]